MCYGFIPSENCVWVSDFLSLLVSVCFVLHTIEGGVAPHFVLHVYMLFQMGILHKSSIL